VIGSLFGGSGGLSTSESSAATGGTSGTGSNSVIYNKPALDLGNPMHIAALLAVVVVVAIAWKKAKK